MCDTIQHPCAFNGICNDTPNSNTTLYICLCDNDYFAGDLCEIHKATTELGGGYLIVRMILTTIYIITFIFLSAQVLYKVRVQKHFQITMSSILYFLWKSWTLSLTFRWHYSHFNVTLGFGESRLSFVAIRSLHAIWSNTRICCY